MGHRRVEGLVWARLAKEVPWGPRRRRPRGAKALGLNYEDKLARALPAAEHGVWFEFADRHGRGFCQPDLILRSRGAMVVLEAKYTWCPEGYSQVDELYKPVLEKTYGLRVVGIQVCKVLVPELEGEVTSSLEGAIGTAMAGGLVTLHWLGLGGLGPCDVKSANPSTPKGATLASLGL